MIAPSVLAAALLAVAGQTAQQPPSAGDTRVKVFLDCPDFCHADYLREEIEFVEYVRDRTDADVHVLVTNATTGTRGNEYTMAFIGLGRFAATSRTFTLTSEPSDPQDQVRRSLASALTVGLLNYVAEGRIPRELRVSAELSRTTGPVTPASDRWKRWIFSLNGDLNIDAEESQRERNFGVSVGADRVTPQWKISIGADFNQSREEFDLDEDEPLSVERRDRSFNWLAVRALGEHWSAGAMGQARSSTFDNTKSELDASPAIEWNFFPYSMYTRRQLRALYAIGYSRFRYFEETLFGKLEETRGRQQLSVTYEQREPWGTIEGRMQASNYFPGLKTHRVSIDAEIDVRVARGLSLSVEASASRIQDQLSLPRRDASAEEVLLRLRRLQSGFETRVEIGIEYQFGSAFAAIVNPRFGR